MGSSNTRGTLLGGPHTALHLEAAGDILEHLGDVLAHPAQWGTPVRVRWTTDVRGTCSRNLGRGFLLFAGAGWFVAASVVVGVAGAAASALPSANS
jgi:hypothetical protein